MNGSRQHNEALLGRPAPAGPYVPAGTVLAVPRPVLARTLAVFCEYGRRPVEGCCFWFGRRDEEGNGGVAALVIPRQRNTWGNYDVDADAVEAMSKVVRAAGWVNLAQVHSHPGARVEHSLYDDEMAASRRALSLVVPSYGGWKGLWPHGIGVHEFQNNYWYLLSDADAAARVVLAETAGYQEVDLR